MHKNRRINTIKDAQKQETHLLDWILRNETGNNVQMNTDTQTHTTWFLYLPWRW